MSVPFLSSARRYEVHEEPVGARDTRGELPEEGVAGVDEDRLAVASPEEAARGGLLARVGRGEHGTILGSPLRGEVESALLHPAVEIVIGDAVGCAEKRAGEIEELDRRGLDRHPIAPELERVGGEVRLQ